MATDDAWTSPELTYTVKTTIEGKEVELKNVSISIDRAAVLNEMEPQDHDCLNCGQHQRFHNGVSCVHRTEPNTDIPCLEWIPILSAVSAQTSARICYTCGDDDKSHCETCEDHSNWFPEEHHGPEGWDYEHAEDDPLMSVEELHRHASNEPDFYYLTVRPNRANIDILLGPWRIMGRSLSHDIALHHIQCRETSINALRYQLIDGSLIEMPIVSVEMVLDHIDWEYGVVYFHDEMQAAGNPVASAQAYLNYIANSSDMEKPKPTEQELLQRKVERLLNIIERIEGDIRQVHGYIEENKKDLEKYEVKLHTYQGELELLTHNLTVDENRQLVAKEVEDCPLITITSLPRKRKWWQFWKPKVMPGVELVL